MAPRTRPDSALVIAALGLIGLGLLVGGLQREHTRRSEAVNREEGRRLYWQVRRTDHVHEPFELINQLHSRTENDRAVLKVLRLQPGDVVADVGCGSGFYTFSLASAVGPQGKVLALDIQEESLAFLRERIDAGGCEACGEIELIHSRLDDPMLPPASVDVMLMAHLDFYAYQPLLPESVQMLARSAAALKPGGRLVVVQDLSAAPGGSEAAIVSNFADAGLVRDMVADFAEGTVLATFVKP
jgi:ubiquinone/menaquinone biosynthesis C-methylase UbiE